VPFLPAAQKRNPIIPVEKNQRDGRGGYPQRDEQSTIIMLAGAAAGDRQQNSAQQPPRS
jgi:hypothetical protein